MNPFLLICRAPDSLWRKSAIPASLVDLRLSSELARRLIDQRLLPAGEMNDGRILAHAAIADVALLVTRDRHLLDVEKRGLAAGF